MACVAFRVAVRQRLAVGVRAPVARLAIAPTVRSAAMSAAAAPAAGKAAPAPPTAAPVALDTFRLRPRQRWQDLAPFVAAVSVSYDPAADGTTGVK
jgi:hypothetical protein